MKPTLQLVVLLLYLSLVWAVNGCSPASTLVPTEAVLENTPAVKPAATLSVEAAPAQQTSNDQHTVAEVETLAGFNVLEPAYLPNGVSFEFATYQNAPTPAAVLHFKVIHEVYGDMGPFFQIMQEPQAAAPPDITSCGQSLEGCEILSIGDKQVVYRLNAGGTEGLDWYADGFVFRLLRTAGEPNRVYKDELISVVKSMK